MGRATVKPNRAVSGPSAARERTNAIRPTAIGKKNWLFIGEAGAGQRGAIIYTITECCRRRGLDPYTYLREVLTRLPQMTNHQVKEVTLEA